MWPIDQICFLDVITSIHFYCIKNLRTLHKNRENRTAGTNIPSSAEDNKSAVCGSTLSAGRHGSLEDRALILCWFYDGPARRQLAQHQDSIESTSPGRYGAGISFVGNLSSFTATANWADLRVGPPSGNTSCGPIRHLLSKLSKPFTRGRDPLTITRWQKCWSTAGLLLDQRLECWTSHYVVPYSTGLVSQKTRDPEPMLV